MYNVPALMLQSDTPGVNPLAAVFGMGFMLVSLLIALIIIASAWKVFEKAGEPGWAAIIPIYNIIIMLKIAGKPAWWVILFLIPFVNLIVAIITLIAFCARFGKGAGFAIGMVILPFIFWPLLAWGGSSSATATA